METSSANVFFVFNGKLVTPKIEDGVLPGVTRQVILSIARALHIPHEERTVCVQEVHGAQEMFITNALLGIVRVEALILSCFEDVHVETEKRCFKEKKRVSFSTYDSLTSLLRSQYELMRSRDHLL